MVIFFVISGEIVVNRKSPIKSGEFSHHYLVVITVSHLIVVIYVRHLIVATRSPLKSGEY